MQETCKTARTSRQRSKGAPLSVSCSLKKSLYVFFRIQGPTEGATASPQRLFKVILVGNSSVGKTALLRRFCDGQFHSATSATVGKLRFTIKLWRVDLLTYAMTDFQEIWFVLLINFPFFLFFNVFCSGKCKKGHSIWHLNIPHYCCACYCFLKTFKNIECVC